jgi:predicted amidophosphoribosyltransferase
MAIELKGNWKNGSAYDVHTLSSVYLGVNEYGHNHWDTTRSDMGELVYQLKYREDNSVVGKIVDLIEGKYRGLETMDAIIPIPSTKKSRTIQPVYGIAQELGIRLDVPVLEDVLEKQTGGAELKNVDDPDERKELLKKYIVLINEYDLAGKNVLLVDDLYRSGSTLTVATDILYQQAKVNDVFVLTMTKTRSKR